MGIFSSFIFMEVYIFGKLKAALGMMIRFCLLLFSRNTMVVAAIVWFIS